MTYKMPEAKEFKRWVTKEVLPIECEKTGKYNYIKKDIKLIPTKINMIKKVVFIYYILMIIFINIRTRDIKTRISTHRRELDFENPQKFKMIDDNKAHELELKNKKINFTVEK